MRLICQTFFIEKDIEIFLNNIPTFKFNNIDIECYVNDGQPWFRGKDCTTILEYVNARQALRVNVDDDGKKKLEELMDHKARGVVG